MIANVDPTPDPFSTHVTFRTFFFAIAAAPRFAGAEITPSFYSTRELGNGAVVFEINFEKFSARRDANPPPVGRKVTHI